LSSRERESAQSPAHVHSKRRCLGLLILTLALASCSSIPLDQSPVGTPQLKIGDRWTTRVVDLWKNEVVETFEQTVASVDGESVVLERKTLSASGHPGPPGQDRVNAATWTVYTPTLTEGREVTLSFPLYVGKTWAYEYKTIDSSGSSTLQSRSAKVEAWEVVSVPAGMYKALKVVVDGRWRAYVRDAMYTGKVTDTLWYVPEAKRWVKREFIDRAPEGRIGEQRRYELMRVELEQ
jgi:hypothetical protein